MDVREDKEKDHCCKTQERACDIRGERSRRVIAHDKHTSQVPYEQLSTFSVHAFVRSLTITACSPTRFDVPFSKPCTLFTAPFLRSWSTKSATSSTTTIGRVARTKNRHTNRNQSDMFFFSLSARVTDMCHMLCDLPTPLPSHCNTFTGSFSCFARYAARFRIACGPHIGSIAYFILGTDRTLSYIIQQQLCSRHVHYVNTQQCHVCTFVHSDQ